MTALLFAIAALVLLALAFVLDRFVSEHAGDVAVLAAYTAIVFGFAMLEGS